MSFGPKAEPGEPSADTQAAATVGTWAAQQAYLLGQESVTQGGYPSGHDLGHDVGLGARNDAGRSFVVGVLEGHAAGLAARAELSDAAKAGQAAAVARDAHARLEARAEAEPEAEAG